MKRGTQKKIIAVLALVMVVLMLLPMVSNILIR